MTPTSAIPALRATGEPVAWLAGHAELVRRQARSAGAVVLCGLEVTSAGRLARLREVLAATRAACQEEFTARPLVADAVYRAADWPGEREMCPHHEQAHALDFPGLLLFACPRPAASGGALLLADVRRVLGELPADLVAAFVRHGWLLRRTYRHGLGPGWPEVFGTTDPATVAAYCDHRGIEHRWLAGDTLWTSQRRPAIVRHPATGEACWFNQVAFFSQWGIPLAEREVLLAAYGADGLPFNTAFGDGRPLAEDQYAALIAAYERAAVRLPLDAGDVLVVDNILMATGREPYTGEREVVVAMADPVFLPGRYGART